MARRNKKCPDCEKMILEYSNKCASCAQKGKIPWNKGIKNTWYNPKGLEIGWKHQVRFKKGQEAPMKGKPNLKIRGENHWRWNGGGKERHLLMGQLEYKLWRKGVFERDDYTCQTCLKRGEELHADHIKPWALYPELRYTIDNGRTLCVACHKQTDTYPSNLRGGVFI